MRRKRRRPGERPAWAPRHVDATIEQVHPLEGLVLLKEVFVKRKSGVLELIEEPGTANTVIADVLAVHDNTAKACGFGIGDRVVLREWAGGRWALRGQPVLLTQSDDVLAKVCSLRSER